MARTIPQWTLGDRLEKALEEGDVSVATMARELRVSRQTVGNYLAGRTKPNAATVMLWAAITGVDAGWLLSGSDEENSLSGCTFDDAAYHAAVVIDLRDSAQPVAA